MPGPPVPQYGNFGGNGDNDAWEQADRYATFSANGYNIQSLVGGSPGSGNLPNPRDYYAPLTVHITRTAANVNLVKAILADIGREPKNDLDTAYLNHDLGFAPDSAIANIINNNAMANSVWNALVQGNSSIDPYGYVYGQASIPFITGTGSAFNILTEVKNQTTPPPNFGVADTVYVYAQSGPINGFIYLTVNLTNLANSTFSGLVTVANNAWSSFSSAMGSGYTNISTALGNAWGWFKEHVLAHENSSLTELTTLAESSGHDVSRTDTSTPDHAADHSLWGDLSGLKLEYVKVVAGQTIDVLHLADYDDNGDGALTLDDKIVASLGIFTPSSGGNAGVLRAFTASDSIDVLSGKDSLGQIAQIGATKDFFNAANVGQTSGSIEVSLAANLSHALLVALVGPQPTPEPLLI
ncbi:MAG: hypothetical protein KKC14_02335 [Alphaproteobacteria bacterium]|nr:hypothetical protein [Alphaproteobacteria bacterium]